jgi:hypothetical protein
LLTEFGASSMARRRRSHQQLLCGGPCIVFADLPLIVGYDLASIAGTRYADQRVTAQWVLSFQKKESVMHKAELHNNDANSDPAPCFATDAEIEIADKLRHQLEERYLAPGVVTPPLQAGSPDFH